MLKHVQHENQAVPLPRSKIYVKGRYSNPTAVGAVWIDKIRRRLDAFHISELAKPIEEKPVSTSDIQNVDTRVFGQPPANFTPDDFFPGTPPPVLFVEFAILRSVFGIQVRSLAEIPS